jgi:hypothetical protein
MTLRQSGAKASPKSKGIVELAVREPSSPRPDVAPKLLQLVLRLPLDGAHAGVNRSPHLRRPRRRHDDLLDSEPLPAHPMGKSFRVRMVNNERPPDEPIPAAFRPLCDPGFRPFGDGVKETDCPGMLDEHIDVVTHGRRERSPSSARLFPIMRSYAHADSCEISAIPQMQQIVCRNALQEKGANTTTRRWNPECVSNPDTRHAGVNRGPHRCGRGRSSKRYASVDQLSEDLRRYSEGLPILARKPTLVYRTTKLVGRNRATALTAAIGFIINSVVGRRPLRFAASMGPEFGSCEVARCAGRFSRLPAARAMNSLNLASPRPSFHD